MTQIAGFMQAVKAYPVIASLRREELLPAAISCKAQVVLISSGDIFNIVEIIQELKKHKKLVLVHVDLISGLGRDHTAVKFLKEKARVTGIVTPSSQLIIAARKEGLLTVQRLFAHDSPSITTGISVLKQSKPHFIEILPGLAVLRVMGQLREHFREPIIAAGLIKDIHDVKLVLNAGAIAIDTSEEKLWNVDSI
ncbi:glycerol-3-phosphate responsive antiterminator [Neomoorella thermoacetica]|uniref:glycerol-3-phosphate responsive antiterminator n=1 Tax=Neomoorella thermoacetica TaxID=1525 RepID=UPI0009084A74|nr:glycerol-3-phosphate responsive antiterminator [Moorella thermoacetica]APC08148.1 glycerol-3-phosphate responsive antiterminator [Moorella thermoacetica]